MKTETTEHFESLDALDEFLKAQVASPEEDDDDEEDDDKKGKENGGDDDNNNVEKSIDVEDIIDVEPVLKAVADNLEHNNKVMGGILKALESLVTITKSQSTETTDMIKSIQTNVEKIGGSADETPGAFDIESLQRKGVLLVKSMGQKEKDFTVTRGVIANVIFSGVKENIIKSSEITKFELGSRFEDLDSTTKSFVQTKLKTGGVV